MEIRICTLACTENLYITKLEIIIQKKKTIRKEKKKNIQDKVSEDKTNKLKAKENKNSIKFILYWPYTAGPGA